VSCCDRSSTAEGRLDSNRSKRPVDGGPSSRRGEKQAYGAGVRRGYIMVLPKQCGAHNASGSRAVAGGEERLRGGEG